MTPLPGAAPARTNRLWSSCSSGHLPFAADAGIGSGTPPSHSPEFRRRAAELAWEVDDNGNRWHPRWSDDLGCAHLFWPHLERVVLV